MSGVAGAAAGCAPWVAMLAEWTPRPHPGWRPIAWVWVPFLGIVLIFSAGRPLGGAPIQRWRLFGRAQTIGPARLASRSDLV